MDAAARRESHSLKRIVPEQRKRKKRDATMRVGVGGIELVKRGASRYDFSDPYHIAIELSWKEFAFAFVGLELGINVVFASLYLASPGCVANMRPGSFSARLEEGDARPFLSIEGRGHAIGALVHDMRIYTAVELLFGMHYAEAVTVDDQRRPVADLTRLSLVEPDLSAHPD